MAMSAAQRAKLLKKAGLDPANFTAVEMQSNLLPFEHPQYVGPGPMRLPPAGSRLRWPVDNFIGDSSAPVDNSINVPVPSGDVPPPLLATGPDNPEWITDPHHYANGVGGFFLPGVVLGANTLIPFLLSPPGKRNMLTLRNANAAGGANIYIDWGKIASVFSPLIVVPGQTILFDTVIPQNDLYALSDAAGGTGLAFSYSNIP